MRPYQLGKRFGRWEGKCTNCPEKLRGWRGMADEVTTKKSGCSAPISNLWICIGAVLMVVGNIWYVTINVQSRGSVCVAGLNVAVLIPRQLCCGLWLADTPIADYHGPIAGQHTTWRGKSTTTWSPATQRDPCVLLLLSSGLTSTHTARNIQRLLSIDFGW